jgi:O-antigen/teichoic acid export membrane protein
VAALLMMAVLIPTGLIFFARDGDVDFSWRLPWVLAVIGTSFNLFVMPFFAIIMGSGDVVTVNKRELVAALLSSLLCWSVIGFHGGLYAAFAVNVGALAISWGYLMSRRPELVKMALKGWLRGARPAGKEPGGLSWWKEIWPMQWRMAVSSGAAYFIFQLFTPVLFNYHGPIVAGQMGMTLTAANALLAGGMTVLNAKTPEFGKLIAVRDWEGLDRLFSRVTRHALLLVLVGAVVGFLAIWQLQVHLAIGRRFIPAGHAALLLGTVCFQAAAGAFAIYLRAHKKEPLMGMTIIASLLQGAGTWYLGKHYGSLGVTAGFLAITAGFVLPYVLFVWRRCRREWHTS